MFAVVCNGHRLQFFAIKRKHTVGNRLSDLCVTDRRRNQTTLKTNVESNVGKPADLNDTVCCGNFKNRLVNGYVYDKTAFLICAAHLCRSGVHGYDFSVYDSRNQLVVRRVVYCRIVCRLSFFNNVYHGGNCRRVIADCVSTELRTITIGRRRNIHYVKHYTGINHRHVYDCTQRYARILNVYNVFRRAICLCRKQKTVGIFYNRYDTVFFAVGNGTTELRFGCTVMPLVDKFWKQQIVVADG